MEEIKAMELGTWADWITGLLTLITIIITLILSVKKYRKTQLYYRVRNPKTEIDGVEVYTLVPQEEKELVIWAINYSYAFQQIYLSGIEVTKDRPIVQKVKRKIFRKKYEIISDNFLSDLNLISLYPNDKSEETIIIMKHFINKAKNMKIDKKIYYGNVLFKGTNGKEYRCQIKFE